jgi:hypothetical protein
MPLRHHLRHPELNTVPCFPIIKDTQNSLTIEFQYRQVLTDDAPAVSLSSFFPWPSDLDPVV